jgi:hypothetical protein
LGELERCEVGSSFITRDEVCSAGEREREREREKEMRKTRSTHVEKEFGKDRKNCLCIVSCNETMRVAKRSRVSWEGDRGEEVSQGKGREREACL